VRLADLLSEDVIKVDLESEDKEEAFAELIELLVRAGSVTDRQAAVDAIISREDQGSTGIGKGVAIPHGKAGCIAKLTAALGISKEGIEYEAVDQKPVHVIFLVLAKPDNPGPHVQCLAEIARLLQQPGFYDRLAKSSSPRQALDIIRAEE